MSEKQFIILLAFIVTAPQMHWISAVISLVLILIYSLVTKPSEDIKSAKVVLNNYLNPRTNYAKPQQNYEHSNWPEIEKE